MRNANSRSKVIVGTTKRSIEAIPSIWLRRKVFQACNGRSRLGTMLSEPWTERRRYPIEQLAHGPWERPTAGFQISFFGSGRAHLCRSVVGPRATGTSNASKR
jgi:hypothetical protein